MKGVSLVKRIVTHKHSGEDDEAAQDPQLEEESRSSESLFTGKLCDDTHSGTTLQSSPQATRDLTEGKTTHISKIRACLQALADENIAWRSTECLADVYFLPRIL